MALQSRLTDVDLSTPLDITEELTTQQAIDLQILLRGNSAKEYYPGAVDGVIGRMSRGSFAAFKADAGLTADKFLDQITRVMLTLGYVPAEAPGPDQALPADIGASGTIQSALDAGVLKVDQGALFGDTMMGPFIYDITDTEGTHEHRVSILVRVKGV